MTIHGHTIKGLILLINILLVTSSSPLALTIEHRFGTSENWKKRSSVSLTFNTENMKYKVESIEDEIESSLQQDKKKLEVSLCENNVSY